MPPATVRDATIDLLLQIDRLLTEADKARALRDHLMDVARVTPSPPSSDAERKVAGDA
jgi:hypothetical protein